MWCFSPWGALALSQRSGLLGRMDVSAEMSKLQRNQAESCFPFPSCQKCIEIRQEYSLPSRDYTQGQPRWHRSKSHFPTMHTVCDSGLHWRQLCCGETWAQENRPPHTPGAKQPTQLQGKSSELRLSIKTSHRCDNLQQITQPMGHLSFLFWKMGW